MFKEFIICTFVVLIIVIGDSITHTYAKESIENLTSQLGELRGFIQEDDNKKAIQKMQEIDDYWNLRYTNLAYFIEHSELEKGQTGLSEVKSNLEVNENSQAIVQLDKSITVLNNINDKLSLKWENIL